MPVLESQEIRVGYTVRYSNKNYKVTPASLFIYHYLSLVSQLSVNSVHSLSFTACC